MLPRVARSLCVARKPLRSHSRINRISWSWTRNYASQTDEYKSKIPPKFREILQERVKRHESLQDQLEKGANITPKEAQLLTKELGQLNELVEAIKVWEDKRSEYDELRQMIKKSSEAEMVAMAQEDLKQVINSLQEAETTIAEYFAKPDSADAAAAIMEIRPAAGGLEAGLFAGEMFEAYQRYAKDKNWQVEIMNYSNSDVGGVKEIIASISGKNVFKYFKFESGVHRVQRVPETETAGRVHTSTMTVAILPEAENVELDIKPTDLRIEAYRAGGAGGQHVNKTESAIRITHLPTGITVAIQEDRSQHRNKDRAMKVLKARLWELERVKVQQQRSSARKSQTGSGERHERIRTYNYPQDRITDHRVNETWHGIEDLMTGDLLEQIHEALLENEQFLAIEDALADAEENTAKAK